ncbi:AfsA-related hotdog domain-containing protein [Enterococcus gilvus]|uniref:A-factor biosynthesis hotdog domain-containing protein n=1 Tax=Enterococcus gilvus ATCC BAA-350 TaxID=1158614 RepID=R2XKI8_9ENTE|nr:AfsA-related hotdog domain-containing protein [Enterococcus gilvus]EOI55449.1 hypothetical protein UKC_02657 [Enterococcus gilvus ATCC BAA-350]EOW82008.1 hypothetical protein I592_01309 [Enterococcus gilvus ATCC BAA-350]OJG43037.1 hypothetical protein RV02_GL002957 [Enterococcus gilvus]
MSNTLNTVLEQEESYLLVYKNSEKEVTESTDKKEIEFSSLRELELLKLALGDTVDRIYIGTNGEIANSALNEASWNYRNPQEMYDISTKIPIPKIVIDEIKDSNKPIGKEMVHKKNPENVLISEPKNHGNVWYFKGFSDIAELNSDHLSDHVDGIKLFEAFRQATLASLHLNGLQHNGVVALTNFKIDYISYVELDEPYIIQAIPACEKDGGAMFCVFNIIQGDKVVTKGFLGAYTFRSKEIYLEKRRK